MSGSPVSASRISVVSPSLLVSMAATPWLSAIVGLQAAGNLLERLGVASEEVFRGDRLPVLHFTDRSEDIDTSADRSVDIVFSDIEPSTDVKI
ncbi:hypothetical protein [Chamaesiphon sp. GL140_3_metabinner_50]|uniref:hypothetical protein n=1 Tax=Chamaesiphon sp. GL140_3_metabinner_50 TaxID=2970812 RepID=UPI0025D93B95|nr:hypothetical protein [Chamaesiphon sp. GL140_3_metabinner_50]